EVFAATASVGVRGVDEVASEFDVTVENIESNLVADRPSENVSAESDGAHAQFCRPECASHGHRDGRRHDCAGRIRHVPSATGYVVARAVRSGVALTLGHAGQLCGIAKLTIRY